MATTSTIKKKATPKAQRGWSPTVKELQDIVKENQPLFDRLKKSNLP